MKKTNYACIFAFAWLTLSEGLRAQNAVPIQTNDSAGWVLSDIGPNSKTWTVPATSADQQGLTADQAVAPPQSRVIEIATGMNFWDGQAWNPSDPTFSASTNGFVASKVQHPVSLSSDLNSIGAVTVRTPDGLLLQSTPVAIALFDSASGQSLIIGSITNTTGIQVSSNQVAYQNAFDGVCADIYFTENAGSFEADVVITGRINPADYGFPTNSTRIQILTEFYNAPDPDEVVRPLYLEQNQAVRNKMAAPDLVDHTLGFGEFVLGPGTAYLAPSASSPHGTGAPTAKEFTTISGRRFLIESVPYVTIAKALQSLPPCGPSGTGAKLRKSKATIGYASIPKAATPAKAAPVQASLPPARMPNPRKGLVIDYIATIGGTISTPFVFQADTTYLVSSTYICNGPATFEGGSVCKLKPNTTIQLNSSVTCKTSSFRPFFITGVDDDSIGDSMNGYSGSGYTGTNNPSGYGNPAIYTAQSSLTLNNVRFRYAAEAIRFAGPISSSYTISHSQFVNCVLGIQITGCGSGTGSGGSVSITLNNDLMANVQTPLLPSATSWSINTVLNHCTIDQSALLVQASIAPGNSVTAIFTNSVLANITTLSTGSPTLSGTKNGFYNCSTFGSSTLSSSGSPFQTVGAGSHYLTNNSNFRQAGTTTGVASGLLSDLKIRTTSPPGVIAQTTLSANLTLQPQTLRDTNSSPDLGYHYDCLDTAFGFTYLTNATMTVNAGTAIATFNTNGATYGLAIGSGAQLTCVGSPTNRNWIVRYNVVQEQQNTNWSGLPAAYSLVGNWTTNIPAPVINCRFTDFSVAAQDAFHFYGYTNTPSPAPFNFQDCQFHGGKLNTDYPTINLTNNLFERVTLTLTARDANTPYLRNNLFWNGFLTLAFRGETNGIIRDNLFDGTTITDTNNQYIGGYNGYITNANRLGITNGTDVILATSPAYQTGPLGAYYLPTNSLLVNAGSTNANYVGLYQYTTSTNQVKETNSVVDLSYHYVAVNTNGLPFDTDGDGIPDYIEDANGNGLFDPGETSWLDPSPTVSITNPTNGQLFVISPTNITLTATASDNGSVTNVAFYSGTNFLGQVTNSPYTMTWSNVAAGTYTLTAIASDNLGAPTVSSPVTITVNAMPSVSLTNPVSGAYFLTTPTNISLSATASDSDGTITNVSFYNGATLLTQFTSSPYNFTWSNVNGGSYTLTATATDNRGASTTSAPVIITANGGLNFGTNNTNAYVTFGANTNLQLRNFTLECWFKRTGTGILSSTDVGALSAVPLITKGGRENENGKTNMNYFLGIDTSGVLAADFEEYTNGANHPLRGVTPISTGVWYHAAVTYNGTNLMLYLDGNLEGQLPVGKPPEYDSIQHAALGAALSTTGAATNGFFSGVMDEARIWNYARSQQQIHDHMSGAVFSDCGLVARWGLDDASGTVAHDSAGSGISGTINGNGWNWTNSAPYNAAGSVLFVVASTNLSGTADNTISNHLQSAGYFITVKAATNVVSTNAIGKNLVLISSSVTSTDVNTKFRTNPVPVITWKQDLYDDLGMVTSNSAFYGTVSGQSQLNIIYPTHPLAAGLTGTLTVVTNTSVFAWGLPNSNAVQIAVSTSNPGDCVLFGYEKGAGMPGLAAPARRVGLFLSDSNSMTSLNTNGWALFDAAVNWAVTAPCPPVLEVMFLMDNSGTMLSNAPPLNHTLIFDATNDAIFLATNLNLTLDRAGVIAFNADGNLRQPLTNNIGAITTGLLSVTNLGAFTRIERAIYAAQDEFNTNHNAIVAAQRVIILFSDGWPSDTNGTYAAAGYAKQNGTRIITVGMGTNVNTLMQGIDSCGDYYHAPDTNGLIAILASITNSLCRAALEQLPSVTITNPVNGQVFPSSPTNILISASATDPDGTIAKVEFFQGTTKLGETNSPPYAFLWQNAPSGVYTLTARATGNLGETNISPPVIITNNSPPIVSITAPADLATFTEVTNVILSATATGSGGTVTNVSFYRDTNSTAIGSTNSATGGVFSIVWSNLNTSVNPIYAKAMDDRGGVGVSAPLVFYVNPSNSYPSVAITFPTNGQTFKAWSDITITATAYHVSGVTEVDFYSGSDLLGADTTPFVASGVTNFEATVHGLKPGTYTFVARAKDTSNPSAEATSRPVTITVQTPADLNLTGYWDQTFQNITGISDFPEGYAVQFDSSGQLFVGATGGNSGGTVLVLTRSSCTWNDPLGLNNTRDIKALCLHGTNMYVGGSFYTTGGSANVAADFIGIWNGTNMTQLGDGLDMFFSSTNSCIPNDEGNTFEGVWTIHTMNGDLYIGGDIIGTDTIGTGSYHGTAANTNIQYVAKLSANATNWSQVGASLLNGRVRAIADFGGTLYIGGDFTSVGTNTAVSYLARLVNGDWQPVGSGVNDRVCALTAHNGRLLVGGEFTIAGGFTNANSIASWDGVQWSTINNGVTGGTPFWGGCPAVNRVSAIAARGNEIYVAGKFSQAWNGPNPIPATCIARAVWNESGHVWNWAPLAEGLFYNDGYPANAGQLIGNGITIQDLAAGTGYEVIVAGEFTQAGVTSARNVARWVVGGAGCPTNTPSVQITAPTFNQTFSGGSVTFTANAQATGTNSISTLAFYLNGSFVTNATQSGTNWTFADTGLAPGVYTLKAVATDNTGLSGSSSGVNFAMTGAGPTANPDLYYVISTGAPTNLYVLTNDVLSVGGGSLRIVNLDSYANLFGASPAGSSRIGYGGGYLTYQANPYTFGTDYLSYSVADNNGTNSTTVTIIVQSPPSVQITSPADAALVNAPAALIVSGTSSDADGSVTNVALLVNGVSAGNSISPTFAFTWTTNTPGFYTLLAVATDNSGLSTTSAPVTVEVLVNPTNAANNHLPVAIITSPTPTVTNLNNRLLITNALPVRTGQLAMTGSAYDPDAGDAVSYQILLLDPANPTGAPLYNVTPGALDAEGFHDGAVTNGSLGTADLSVVADGAYQLTLRVRGGGDVVNASMNIAVESALKIGQFSFSEQDMVLPVNGVPITVVRTYNSLNPRSTDFGYGWTYSLNSMDVQLDEERTDVTIGDENAPFADVETDPDQAPLVVSIRTGGSRDVTLTLPDGRRVTYAFNPRMGLFNAYAEWKAPPGVTATLTASDAGIINLFPLQWQDGGVKSTWDNTDVPGWILQTVDGTQYKINRGTANNVWYDLDGTGNFASVGAYGPPKLTSIAQRTGDQLIISDSSIYHVDTNGIIGRAISFTRDSQDRITAIYDPNTAANGLPVLQYVYNQDTGNLIQVLKLVDRAGGTYTTNSYRYDNPAFPHYLTEVDDPLGVPAARNFYDTSGRLIEVDDADGNKTLFNHNTAGSMEVVVDRLNHTNSYVYDLQGNVTTTTNALNQVTLMAYDANNNKTNQVAFLNGAPYATNSFVYDTTNQLLSSTDPLGHGASFVYNLNGQVTVSTDARNSSSTNYYDGSGNLAGTSDALGNSTSNYYNSSSLLTGSRDAVGTVTTNYYSTDIYNNLIASAVYSGASLLSTNTFGYDPNGNRTNSTVWRRVNGVWTGAVTAYVFDGQNRVIQTIDPDGGTNTVIYNAIGKQQATVNKLGYATQYFYDDRGNLTNTTYPDLLPETASYDSAGNRINSVDRGGRTNSYFYDALNRQTQTVYADNTTNTTVYDDVGRVKFNVDARGITNAFGYDAASRRVAVTNAWGTTVAQTNLFGFDAVGNQVYFTNALKFVTTNVFDALNRQAQVVYADGTKTSTGYDAAGRRVADTNQDGVVTRFGYDGMARLIAVTNALGTTVQMVTQFQYDEAGNEIAQIDALNRTNTYQYDGLSRRIQHAMPGNQTETFGYDLGGNLIRYTNFTSTVITNQYDLLNRLTNRASVNGYNASFAYSPTGQRTNMVDVSGTNSYSYDNRDRLQLKKVAWSGGPNITLNYQFDPNGNLTNLWSSSSGGVTNFYQFDALNRPTNVLANGATAAYGFDAVGNLQTMRYGNGVTNQLQYDTLNRLTNAVWKTNAGTIASFYYQLGSTGNRTNLAEVVNGVNRTNQWKYDSLYRLTSENIIAPTAGTLTYGFDGVGNRLARTNTGSLGLTNQTLSFNTNDWLVSDTYDNNGNSTASFGNAYQYDALNHLTNANSGAVLIWYDGDGNRVKKTVGTTATFFLIDDRNLSGYVQVLEEWTASGGATNLSRVFNYGLQLISQRQPAVSTNYFIFDGHGSTRILTDNAGNVANAFTFDAYGTLIASNAAPQTVYLYSGEQFDPDLGFYYLRARYINPGTGRFWTMDSFDGNNEDPLSLHRFLYAENNPVNGLDPSGLFVDFESFSISQSLDKGLEAGKGVVLAAANRQAIATIAKVTLVATLAIIPALSDEESEPMTESERQRIAADVQIRLNADKRKNQGQLLFHYTSAERALNILALQYIYPSVEDFDYAAGQSYPAGAYATDISPLDNYSMRELANIIYFNPAKAARSDLRAVVVILNKRPRGFTYLTTHQYYRASGDVFAIDAFPNPMRP
jgi:RHS repeat-associated protein